MQQQDQLPSSHCFCDPTRIVVAVEPSPAGAAVATTATAVAAHATMTEASVAVGECQGASPSTASQPAIQGQSLGPKQGGETAMLKAKVLAAPAGSRGEPLVQVSSPRTRENLKNGNV